MSEPQIASSAVDSVRHRPCDRRAVSHFLLLFCVSQLFDGTLSWILMTLQAASTSSSSRNRRDYAVGRNEKGPAVSCRKSGTKGTKAEAVARERQSKTCCSKCRATAGRHKSATERKRQAAETPDHREARLVKWRAAQQELEIGS